VDADVRRLDRILGNLLDNARLHAAGAAVEVRVAKTGGSATVTVADRGPGVLPEALDHLFDRFYKADPSRHSGSSGLGLAIAAEHAALLGGGLRAANQEGGGLAVTLSLPVTASLPPGDGADTPAEHGGDGSDAPSAPTKPARPS
jgi:two-component system sensor histidine kinase MtrB